MSSTRTNRFIIDDTVARLKAGELTPCLIQLWYLIPKLDPKPDGEDRFWLVNALYHLGLAFDQEQVYDKATEIFTDCLARFGDVPDQDTAELLNMVAAGAGKSAARANHFDEAVQYLDRAAERLKHASSITDRRALVDALVTRAAVVRQLGQVEDTVAAYSLVYDRFRNDNDPEICSNLALVLDEKAKVLKNGGLNDRADEAARFFISEFEASWDPVIIERLIDAVSRLPADKRPEYVAGTATEPRTSRRARLMVLRGTGEMAQNDIDSALRHFDQAVQLLATEPDEEDHFWQAQAIHNRGVALQRSQRNADAVASFTEVFKRFQTEPADQFRKLVDSALINAAVCAAGVQLFDQALVYIDLVIDRLRDATQMADRRSLANAMYNRATILRMAGRVEDAVKAFDAICKRFRLDDDPKVYRFVGMAYYNKATTLSEADLLDLSTAAFEKMAEECCNAQDPFVRERAARAVLAFAGNKLAAGESQEHVNTLVTLVAMYGTDPEPAIQQVVGKALLAFPPLLIRLPPASHERNSPYNRQTFGSLINDFRDRPAVLERHLADYQQSLDRATEIDASEHAEAIGIVEAFWTQKKPFALFLRNFDKESSNIAVPMGLEFPMRAALILPGYHDIEERIKAAVGKHIPIISISNPSPGIPTKSAIPRLELNNDLWESALQVLIHSAGLIVMMLDQMTTGVSRELEAIVRQNRSSSTVLIVSPSVEEQLPLIAEFRKAQLAGGLEPAESGIPRFALVVSPDDLRSNDGHPLPEITKLADQFGFTGSASA